MSRRNSSIRTALFAGAAFAGIAATPAFAQDSTTAAAAQTAETEDGTIADDGGIIVTARRRAESLINVPIAVTAISGAQLEASGAIDITDVAQSAPNVTLEVSRGTNSTLSAFIRGVGQQDPVAGFEAGVGIYLDDVYLNRPQAAVHNIYDVERIEVLRGPQGTLYGKNTVAGAINITSKAPSFHFEGRAELSIGNLEFKQAKASVSGPLSDSVAVRLGISSTSRRGTIYNVATGNYVNAQDNIGLRGAILWNAADNLKLTLSGDYNRQNPECCAQIYVRYGPTQRAANRQYPALTAAFNYAVPSTDPFDRLTDVDAELSARNVLGGVSLRGELDLGSGTLTSVSAWRFWDWGPKNDRDFTGLPITTLSQNPTRQDQFTQEFRYAGEGNGFDYVIGAFGFYQDIHTTGSQRQGPAGSRWLLAPSNALSNDPSVLDGLTAENDIRLRNFSGALFAKFNWKLGDRFTLSPGVRVNYDDKVGSYVSVVRDSAGVLVPYSGGTARQAAQREAIQPQAFTGEAYRAWNVSYDLTASYKPSRDVLLYATYAHTFKSGGLNLNGVPVVNGVVQTNLAQVAPEKVDHFEIGAKTQFWDRKATLNLTGYWTSIKDYQAVVNNGSTSTLRGYLANAGEVRVRGIEADFSLRPTRNLSLYVNGAYTDHEYVKFVNAPCPPELSGGTAAPVGSAGGTPGVPGQLSPVVCDISGQWLPGISNWAFSYGGEYSLPAKVFDLDGEFYIGADASTRSKFSSNASRSIYTDIDGYTLANARIGFRTGDFNIFGWVRNALDAKYFDLLATTPGNTGLIAGNPGDPRTYGLTISKAF